ncbi:MAG: hypothetical protein WC758_05650 [Candidatus Woesearchaeota archaeon]|jgi:uncharacterized membrane protein
MNKNFKIMSVFLIISALILPMVMADTNPPQGDYAEITEIKINGDIAENGDDLYVERGDDITVRVTIKSVNGDMNDAYLGAFISGYRYAAYESNLVTDFSNTFTLPEGNKRSIELNLKVPMDMETKDAKLRVILFDENSASIISYNYQLSIYGANEDNAVEIRDFFISPSTTIEAGRALSFKVKIKNFGNNDLDDLKVKVSIPELDIQTVETIDTLEIDEVQSFEALLLRIPADANIGDYDVIASVEYDRYQEVSETQSITVISAKGTPCAGETCDNSNSDLSKTLVTMPASVEVITGSQGSIYPILVENKGTTQKTYVLSVSGTSDWALAVFEPSSVFVLKPGQAQTVYMRLTPTSNAQIGDKVMKIAITAGNEMKDTTVIASVKQGTTTAKSKTNMTGILEWFLVILVVVLILLGLIVAFKKLKKGKEEEEEQSYY